MQRNLKLSFPLKNSEEYFSTILTISTKDDVDKTYQTWLS